MLRFQTELKNSGFQGFMSFGAIWNFLSPKGENFCFEIDRTNFTNGVIVRWPYANRKLGNVVRWHVDNLEAFTS